MQNTLVVRVNVGSGSFICVQTVQIVHLVFDFFLCTISIVPLLVMVHFYYEHELFSDVFEDFKKILS